jgi:hypothetical protein
MKARIAAFAVLLALIAPLAAKASLTVLVTSAPAVLPGSSFTFKGNLTNTSATETLWLNQIDLLDVTPGGPNITLNQSATLALWSDPLNIPLFLSPLQSAMNLDLFVLDFAATAPVGSFTGDIAIFGGVNDPLAFDDLGHGGFAGSIVPEGNAMALMVGGLAPVISMFALRRRRKA